MIKKLVHTIIHILNVFLIIFTFWLIILSLFRPDLIENFVEWMKVVVKVLWNWNYVIIFLTAFVESFPLLGVAVPWQNIMLIVWWFFGVDYLYEVIWIAIIWALLGNYVWYVLWVFYWEKFFIKYWDWVGIWMTELKYMKKWIHKHGWWMIVVWKFHNMLRAFVPFIAWSMGMKNKNFLIFNVVWSILRAVVIILLWVVFVQYYKIVLSYAPYVMSLIFIFIWFYIYIYKRQEFKNYLKEKEQEIENKFKL
jgi:membrane protein DedA with SNARE-associated domain